MSDPLLPVLHPRPPQGWVNDPHAPYLRDGVFHLFMQHRPDAPSWGSIRWAHLSSVDLVHWREEPIALAPEVGSADADGCWTGCAVDTGDHIELVYTGVQVIDGDWRQRVCVAAGPEPDGRWRAIPESPVIDGPPPGETVLGFRDPFVFVEAGRYRMIIGSGRPGSGGCIFTYVSDDLRRWSYEGVFLDAQALPDLDPWAGTMWECPQFVTGDDGAAAVIISAHDDGRFLYSLVISGRYDGRGTFRPLKVSRADFGHDAYALTVARLGERLLAWAWSWEARDISPDDGSTWAGLITLPRVVTVSSEGVGFAPLPELARLRTSSGQVDDAVLAYEPHSVSPGLTRTLSLEGEVGAAYELEVDVDGGRSASVQVEVSDPGAPERRTVLTWDRYAQRLHVDRQASPGFDRSRPAVASVPVDSLDRLQFKLIVDRTILELFTSDGRALTERVESSGEGVTVRAVAYGGAATVRRLAIWDLKPTVSQEP